MMVINCWMKREESGVIVGGCEGTNYYQRGKIGGLGFFCVTVCVAVSAGTFPPTTEI